MNMKNEKKMFGKMFDPQKNNNKRYLNKCIVCLLMCFIIIYLAYINTNEMRFKPCDISEEKNNHLRLLLKTVSKALEKHKVTYWVDFGTALGAHRYCDIIPWDHDADMGYLESDYVKVTKAAMDVSHVKGFTMDNAIAYYGGHYLDIARWEKVKNWWIWNTWKNFITGAQDTDDNYKLRLISTNINPVWLYIRNTFLDFIPYKFLGNRSRVTIDNFQVYAMRNNTEFIQWRYFLTYDKVVPYYLDCLKGKYSSTSMECNTSKRR